MPNCKNLETIFKCCPPCQNQIGYPPSVRKVRIRERIRGAHYVQSVSIFKEYKTVIQNKLKPHCLIYFLIFIPRCQYCTCILREINCWCFKFAQQFSILFVDGIRDPALYVVWWSSCWRN
jgi:hypothetical protein